jgi:hypothetical protein
MISLARRASSLLTSITTVRSLCSKATSAPASKTNPVTCASSGVPVPRSSGRPASARSASLGRPFLPAFRSGDHRARRASLFDESSGDIGAQRRRAASTNGPFRPLECLSGQAHRNLHTGHTIHTTVADCAAAACATEGAERGWIPISTGCLPVPGNCSSSTTGKSLTNGRHESLNTIGGHALGSRRMASS